MNDFESVENTKQMMERKRRLEASIVNDEAIIANALERIKGARKELADIVSRETESENER